MKTLPPEFKAKAELGGDCLCGRGPAIGTCVVTAYRLWFRSFREQPAAYHLEHVTDWVCVDCVADAALDVAKGQRPQSMSSGPLVTWRDAK